METPCSHRSADSLWPGKISCEILPKGRILPHSNLALGGVCRADGSFVESSALHEELYDGSYPYDEAKVEKKAGVAVFLGTWHKLYGHRFTDNIKKLWYLFSPEYKALCEEYADKGGVDLVYTYMWGREATACMDEVCSALGLDVRTMHPVYAVTEYDKVIVPDNSFILHGGVRYYTPQYKDLIARICEYGERNAKGVEFPDSIYLTRRNFPSDKDFGDEKPIEEAFERQGYTVITPEKYSFIQQVAMMQHCSRLAATEGSISHNAVFCRPRTILTILRKIDWSNSWQVVIDGMNDLDVTYIDAHYSYKSRLPWEGPFFIWKTKQLMDYLGEEGREKCRWLSPLWYKYLWAYVRFQSQPIINWFKNLKFRFWQFRQRHKK